MAVFRKGSGTPVTPGPAYPAPYTMPGGALTYTHLSDPGGLTQFGIALETLHPGGQSSQMHWESHEDEFCYLLEGAMTVVEDGEETVIHPGDWVCWKAGTPVAHCLRNHTAAPATYLILGARDARNICTYPGLDMLGTANGHTHLDGTPYEAQPQAEE
ncbi:cupin domain-containing protein [Pseudoroseicyclus sp. H15]